MKKMNTTDHITDSSSYSYVEAHYVPSPIPEYAGNPLIEALPPLLPDEEALRAVCWQPSFSPEERALPTGWRLTRMLELRKLIIPLERHAEVLFQLDAMLRAGYVGREPHSPERARLAQKLYEMRQQGKTFSEVAGDATAGTCTGLIGSSGTGKTTLVVNWAKRIPKVIYHPRYHIYQVPVLRADAPSDGSSMKGFCYALLHELDRRIPNANYFKEYGLRAKPGADSVLRNLIQVLNMHCVGMLIVDEAQNFANSHKNGQIVMTEIVSAFNELRAPIVFIGTNKAYRIFETDFRAARRVVAPSLMHWDRIKERPAPGEPDEWAEVVLQLWKFQWVRNPTELDEWTLQVLYECTQGIPGLLVALFYAAQKRAMLNGSEALTPELIRQVYDSEFTPVHPMINALRDDDQAALQRYEDLAPPLEQTLNRIWQGGAARSASYQRGPVHAAPTEGAVDGDTLPDEPKRLRARIRSRVAPLRVPRTRKKANEPSLADQEFDSSDYRSALKAAEEHKSSVYEELLRLGLMPTPQQFLETFM